MAISSLPSDGGGDDGAEGIVAEINVTPLTDIFLVLLIIFMVTTTVMQDEGKNIDLPTATESEETPGQPDCTPTRSTRAPVFRGIPSSLRSFPSSSSPPGRPWGEEATHA